MVDIDQYILQTKPKTSEPEADPFYKQIQANLLMRLPECTPYITTLKLIGLPVELKCVR
jgi:hypothetical protein